MNSKNTRKAQYNVKKETKSNYKSNIKPSIKIDNKVINSNYQNKNFLKNGQKKDYSKQVVKTQNRYINTSPSPSKKSPLKKSSSILKNKSTKNLYKSSYKNPNDSKEKKRNTNSSYFSLVKNENKGNLSQRNDYKYFSSQYTNRKETNQKNQNININNHNRTQTMANNYSYNNKLFSPTNSKNKIQYPLSPKQDNKRHSNMTDKYKNKLYQSQTFNTPIRFSTTTSTTNSTTQSQTFLSSNNKRNYIKNLDSSNIPSFTNINLSEHKCPICNNYLIEQKIYTRTIPTKEISLMNESKKDDNSKRKLKKVKLNLRAGKTYGNFNEDGTIETTVLHNRYDPNIYINEKGTSCFKPPIKSTTVVEHVKNKKQTNYRYYNDKKTFGHNNMEYYEINASPEKQVFIRPLY